MSNSISRHSRRTTPWDAVENKSPTQQFLFDLYQKHYIERHPPLNTTGEEILINSFKPDSCPYCNEVHMRKNGLTNNGVQRYLCLSCGKKFTPVTGTIFENHKISITEWMEYTLNILRYVSINAGSWNNKNAFTTSRYWLEKLFILLEESTADIMLTKRVWLDETYYSVRSDDIKLNENGLKPRGLSRNQICIGVACDENQIFCTCEGFGQPTRESTYEAFEKHIAHGSVLVHDKSKVHGRLIDELGLISDEYDSSEIKLLPDSENPMNRVNEVHARLKDFLNAHSSFNRDNLLGYLNLFTFAMNPPTNNLQKVELLLEKGFKTRKTLKYRQFYNVNE